MFTETHVYSGSNRIPLKIHECRGRSTIIINYPGYNGTIDGYQDKYVKLADYMVREGLGTVVRLPNTDHQSEESYATTVQRDLRVVIEHMLVHSGESDPAIYLMGTSAGGSAVATVASSYRNVKKILLIAPSLDVSHYLIERGINEFTGEVSILSGEDDPVCGARGVDRYARYAVSAKRVQQAVIPVCDHHFSGTTNGMILSRAPFWAFAQDVAYPDATHGIELY